MNTRKLAELSMLTSAALIVFIVELRFPDILPVPGVKLGLANIFTVYAVYRFKAKEVFLMVITRSCQAKGKVSGTQTSSFR